MRMYDCMLDIHGAQEMKYACRLIDHNRTLFVDRVSLE